MASLSKLHADAMGNPNGFSGARTDTYAVSVAVGPAAAGRGHAGRIVVTVEWYRPEGFDDDDASRGGFLLRTKSGHARVAKEVVVDEIGMALEAVRKATPNTLRAAVEA